VNVTLGQGIAAAALAGVAAAVIVCGYAERLGWLAALAVVASCTVVTG